jgi:hypothetical protein
LSLHTAPPPWFGSGTGRGVGGGNGRLTRGNWRPRRSDARSRAPGLYSRPRRPLPIFLFTSRDRTMTSARASLELGLGLGWLNLVAATVDAQRACRAAAHDESRHDDHRLYGVAALLGLEGAQRLQLGQLPRPQRAVAAAAVAHGRRGGDGQHRPLVLERLRAERPVSPPERSKAARSATLGRLQRAAAASLWHPSGGGSPLGPKRGPWAAGGLLERWVVGLGWLRARLFRLLWHTRTSCEAESSCAPSA